MPRPTGACSGRWSTAGFGLTDGLLSPFTIPPKHPLTLVRYGAVGLLPAHTVARRGFDTDEAQALFAGLAGHSILSLKAPVTAGYGLMLGVLAHLVGWPLARGGSQQIADALVAVLDGLGGTGRVRPPGRLARRAAARTMRCCSTSPRDR